MWDTTGELLVLPQLPDGRTPSEATGVSAAGDAIVGAVHASGSLDQLAVIWHPTRGSRYLQDVLVGEFNLDLTGWTLQDAYTISADGSTIAGYGLNPDGDVEGFVARLPEPATFALISPLVLLARRR